MNDNFNIKVWKNWIDSIDWMETEEQKGAFCWKVMQYIFYGIEPEIEQHEGQTWACIKPLIDTSLNGVKEGRKGGRPKTENPQKNPTENPSQNPPENPLEKPPAETPTETLPFNEYETETEIETEIEEDHCRANHARPSPDDYREIVGHLNEKTGRNFSADNKQTRSRIRARYADGYRKSDFFTVIDNQCSKWLTDSKMSEYLRPETLFGTKFEGYLQNRKAVNPYAIYD